MEDSIYEGLLRYFNSLVSGGYYNYVGTSKLLFLILVEEFMEDDFSYLLDDDSTRLIENMKNSLLGTDCLLPVPGNC